MAINTVDNKNMGISLWIAFQSGFTSLVNNDAEDFGSLTAIADSNGAAARQVNFALEPARPVSNAQMRNPGAKNAAFLNGEAETIVEKTATAKQLDIVGEFDHDVFARCEMDPSQIYVGPMGKTVHNMQINAHENLLLQYYGDGSGAVATLGTIGSATIAGGEITIPISNVSTTPGCIYWLREEAKLVAYKTDGTAHDPTVSSGTVAYLKVTAVDHDNKKATFAAYDSSDVKLTVTAASTLDTGDVLYNYSDESEGGVFNRSAISDYGDLLYMPGLQALGADNGITVNDVVLSGAYAGSNRDLAGASLFFTDIGALMSKIDRRVGQNKYLYEQAKCSFDTWNYLINLDEGSKYLKPMENVRGGKSYMYHHQGKSIEVVSRRFVPDAEMWFEPKLKNPMAAPGVTNDGPLMFKFTGFDYIKVPGSNDIFREKVTSAGRLKVIQTHLQTFGTFVATQNASIGRIKNFIIS
jgi:hypothetical protein